MASRKKRIIAGVAAVVAAVVGVVCVWLKREDF